MKILQIIPNLASGGAERFVVDLSNEMIEQGHEIVLCTLFDLNENNSFFKNELDNRIQLISLSKKIGFDYIMYFKLIKTIFKVKPNVVHSHLNVINYLFLGALFFRFFSKIKFVHTLHSDASKLFSKKYEKYIRKLVYQYKFVHPVVISEVSRESFENIYGENVKSSLIYNGRKNQLQSPDFESCKVFYDNLRDKEGTVIFLHIGRFIEVKNQLNLLDAIIELKERGVDIKLLFIGEGFEDLDHPNLKILESKIREKAEKHSEIIHLLGRKTNIVDYLMLADALLLPSIYEGMPITVIEALSVGCIPICNEVGGLINMIQEKKNGLFFKGSKKEDIVKGIEEYGKLNENERNIIRQNAKKSYIEKFSIKKSTKEYIDCFKKL